MLRRKPTLSSASVLAVLVISSGMAAWSANLTPYDPIAYPGGTHPDRRSTDSLLVNLSPIRVNQAGYLPSDTGKAFFYVGSADNFQVVLAADSSKVGEGSFVSLGVQSSTTLKVFADSNTLEFSSNPNTANLYQFTGNTVAGDLLQGKLPANLPTDQPLRVKVGDQYSTPFLVSNRVYTYVRNASLPFLGMQRSRHTSDPVPGGWYDCGDYLKESQTQAYAAAILAVMAAAHSNKDQDQYNNGQSDPLHPDDMPDILSEAKHGADFALAAYDAASGVIDNMALSVGDFATEHSYWGKATDMEALNLSRPARLGELGSNISGQFAANLALVGKLMASRDKAYSDKCLKVAAELYDFAKQLALGKASNTNNTRPSGWSSLSYNGNNEFFDDLALASIALFYATGNSVYLQDAAATQDFTSTTPSQRLLDNADQAAGIFNGGWLVTSDMGFMKGALNSDWTNCYTLALYAFYSLVLRDDATASSYGISANQRLEYLEDIAYTMAANLGDIAQGPVSINLPTGYMSWKPGKIGYNPAWYTMSTSSSFRYSTYATSNVFDLLAYSEVTNGLDDIALPVGGKQAWHSSDARSLALRQMDFVLGANPWELSLVTGIGARNHLHPQHRETNPEGRNRTNLPDYPFLLNVGAMVPMFRPGVQSNENYSFAWEDYMTTESCLQSNATLTATTHMLADGSFIKVGEEPVAVHPATEHFRWKAVRTPGGLALDIQAPRSGTAQLRLLRATGSVVLNQTIQMQAGANQWNIPLSTPSQGMLVVQWSMPGSAIQSAIVAPLVR